VIEGVYAVRRGVPVATAADVDRPGIRVGVTDGSAYDLYLTRTLTAAEIVRGHEGTAVADASGLEVAAGIRAPTEAWAATRPGWAVVEPCFMPIRQALAVPRGRRGATVDFLRAYVEARKADGFVAEALARSGRTDARVAPPAAG
jgi:polar amino acid transport system substrate-binding protein